MDRQIIQSFRDKVNEKDFVLFKYRDNNNKNLWNCICSAMDWIEVSVEYICRHPLRSVGPEQSIELYAYLASVDIIVEAVEQLHRVFFSLLQSTCLAAIGSAFTAIHLMRQTERILKRYGLVLARILLIWMTQKTPTTMRQKDLLHGQEDFRIPMISQ